jgi:ADP-heptose:LPS heptosyltransferase
MAGIFYNRRATHFPEDRHVIFKNIHLLSLLGIQDEGVGYPLKQLSMSDKLSEFMRIKRLGDRQFGILNVGAGWPTKILRRDQYVEIVKGIEPDIRLIILWGNEKEKLFAEHISRETGALISPFLDFPDLILLIQKARFLISGDTLALHLADMVQTPSVGLFGPTAPQRNGSLLEKSIDIFTLLPCSFCYKRKCDTMSCMYSINSDEIIAATRTLYEE